MGTYSSNLLPNSTGLDLGAPSQRWDGFFKDINVTGTITPVPNLVSIASSSNPVFDGSTGTTFLMTMTSNVATSSVANLVPGQRYVFILVEDGTGGRTFTWPPGTRGGMVVDTTASAYNVQEMVFDGSILVSVSSGVSV